MSFKATFYLNAGMIFFPWVGLSKKGAVEAAYPIFDTENTQDPLPNPSQPKTWKWSSFSDVIAVEGSSVTCSAEGKGLAIGEQILGFGS